MECHGQHDRNSCQSRQRAAGPEAGVIVEIAFDAEIDAEIVHSGARTAETVQRTVRGIA